MVALSFFFQPDWPVFSFLQKAARVSRLRLQASQFVDGVKQRRHLKASSSLRPRASCLGPPFALFTRPLCHLSASTTRCSMLDDCSNLHAAGAASGGGKERMKGERERRVKGRLV